MDPKLATSLPATCSGKCPKRRRVFGRVATMQGSSALPLRRMVVPLLLYEWTSELLHSLTRSPSPLLAPFLALRQNADVAAINAEVELHASRVSCHSPLTMPPPSSPCIAPP